LLGVCVYKIEMLFLVKHELTHYFPSEFPLKKLKWILPKMTALAGLGLAG